MVGVSTFVLFGLGLLRLGVVAQATSEPPTLDDVDAQLSTYLELLGNGTVSTRGSPARSVTLPSGCDLACGFLGFSLKGQISYPGSLEYQFGESQYWSAQQASNEPICRFTPRSAVEVSLGVLTLRLSNCKFAVKSGGHAAFAGASNIDNGIAIDLAKLNQVTVSADKKQTSVGPGNVWYDVYSKLDPMGLSVIGGRVSAIGVGGLTLGGGVSFFSNRYGWACDNVNKYQVVLADGSIHEVTPSSLPDLYFALRGGGNNFGIVTRFDLVTFPQGKLWGGSQTFLYSPESAAGLNEAFNWLAINGPADPYAQVILAYAYVQYADMYVIAADLQYGKPVENPPMLQNFTAVQGTVVSDTLRIATLSELTVELNNSNPGGFRQSYWTLMTGNSPTLMADIIAIYQEETNAVKDAEGLVSSCIFQPVGTNLAPYFARNGGNALGIDLTKGPQILLNIAISWSHEIDDTRVYAAARNIVNRSNATAYAAGLGNAYLYQNYASAEQDVFGGYGAKNLAKLKAISTKYDPNGVWQKLQPGYFKIR
ncbi:hypothetical protein V502_01502 [Pseudogymnoascus sp. VKM F-4520 (FW-2644)]|nr:hypothetical protein V502_01502 [Pseudogymnoascus sp. VKM F-4520 (FW-2644)]